MGLLLGATFVGFVLVCLGGFISWRRRVLTRVLRGGEIAETAKGPVEFGMAGTGPVILHLHGGASGYDQTLALSWDLHEAGFTVLTPSRPGYLRTPLTTGASPEQAADVLAGLLDVLSIDKVCVMGTSGGGPTALQFALRHPDRVWGLVLQAAISQHHVQPRRTTSSLIGMVDRHLGLFLSEGHEVAASDLEDVIDEPLEGQPVGDGQMALEDDAVKTGAHGDDHAGKLGKEASQRFHGVLLQED